MRAESPESSCSRSSGRVSPPGAVAALKRIWQNLRREHAAFITICLYLIFEYNKPQLIWREIDIIPWGKVILLLALVFTSSDKESNRPQVNVLLPLTVFSTCVVLSMFYAFSPPVAFKEWNLYFSSVFVTLLITSVVSTRQRLFLFLAVYFLVNLKMAQHGFRSWALRGFSFADWGVSGSPGWFQNSGEFSMQMTVFLPLVLSYTAFFRREWSRSVRLFFYLLIIMVTGSILASSNRGAILGLIIVGLWGLIYARQRFKAILIVAVSGALIYYFMPIEFKDRFETAGKDKTSVARINYLAAGIEAIEKHPYFGIGYRNWTTWVAVEHPELKVSKIGGFEAEVIHNTYMEVATELGYTGLIVYILILLQIFFTNRRSSIIAEKLNDRFLKATATGLNGSLFVYLGPSYFMSVLYYPYLWILLSTTLIVSNICKKHGKLFL